MRYVWVSESYSAHSNATPKTSCAVSFFQSRDRSERFACDGSGFSRRREDAEPVTDIPERHRKRGGLIAYDSHGNYLHFLPSSRWSPYKTFNDKSHSGVSFTRYDVRTR